MVGNFEFKIYFEEVAEEFQKNFEKILVTTKLVNNIDIVVYWWKFSYLTTCVNAVANNNTSC